MEKIENKSRKSVIIYDYDRRHTDLLINALNKQGFEVAIVNGTVQLMRQVQLTKPCAVVTEISPVLGASPDLIRLLRHEGFGGTVIAISPRAPKSDFDPRKEADDAGADLFLFKPVDCGVLGEALADPPEEPAPASTKAFGSPADDPSSGRDRSRLI